MTPERRCEKCLVAFEKADDLNQHLKTCFDKGPPRKAKRFQCKECSSSPDQEWLSSGVLQFHLAEVHQMEMFVCDQCGFYVPNKKSLKAHKGNVHQKAKLCCKVCQKTF